MLQSIKLGWAAPKIRQQLDEAKMNYHPNEVSGFQKCADSISCLAVHGLITVNGRNTLYSKLQKKIEKHLKELNS